MKQHLSLLDAPSIQRTLGGMLTLYSKDYAHILRTFNLPNEDRISVVLLETAKRTIALFNIYAPANGNVTEYNRFMKHLAMILRQLRAKKYLLAVMGNFNNTLNPHNNSTSTVWRLPQSSLIQLMSEFALRDIQCHFNHRWFDVNNKECYTQHGATWSRIDHCLVSTSLLTNQIKLDCQILPSASPSDHRPLRLTLRNTTTKLTPPRSLLSPHAQQVCRLAKMTKDDLQSTTATLTQTKEIQAANVMIYDHTIATSAALPSRSAHSILATLTSAAQKAIYSNFSFFQQNKKRGIPFHQDSEILQLQQLQTTLNDLRVFL